MIAIKASSFLISPSLAAVLSPPVDAVRELLQENSDKWFHWLLISSALVALGVAFEAPESTIALKRWYRLKRRRDVPPDNETSWAIPASYLGLILVIAGVVGEGVFEGLLSNADTALRSHDDQILAETQKKAGDAKTSADAAVGDATQIAVDLQTATSDLAKANEGVKKAEHDAGAANIKAAGLELKAEELRKANDELESDLSPRLFRNQSQAIESLSEFHGTTVELKYLLDPESKRTAEQINLVLHRARWRVIPEPASLQETDAIPSEFGFFDGVTVSRGQDQPKESDELSKHRLGTLLTILNNSGIESSTLTETSPRNQTRYVEIWVGLKPSPALEKLRGARADPSAQRLYLPSHIP